MRRVRLVVSMSIDTERRTPAELREPFLDEIPL